MEWVVWCLAGVSIILFVLLSKTFNHVSTPPGPTPLPIIGNLLYIAREHPVSYIALHRISKKYGNITSLKIGSDNIVLLSTSEVARDFYSRSECLDRPTTGPLRDRMLNQNIGMAFSNGDGWNDIRKFASRTLREYGFGNKNVMERIIRDELCQLTNHIDNELARTTDQVLYFNKFFQPSLLNLITSMITGKRYQYDNVELKALNQASQEWFDAPILGILTVMAFPWTRFVFPKILGYTQIINALKVMQEGMRKILRDHRDKSDFMENPQCFTDSFLKMAHEKKNDPTSLFSDDQFAVLGTDLLQGGTDTSSTWLSWAILLLTVNHPVQDKVVKEIEKQIGYHRLPECADKERMVYTQAVILEIHRCCRMIVNPPPRVVTEDFYYQNYLIKQGSMIMVNLHSCYMNPDEWDNPEEFCPERFLGADSSTFINTEKMNFIYGAGRRNCFGESLAKESVFLYLTTLLQKFSFHAPPSDYPSLGLEPVPALVLAPKPYYVHIRKRNS